MRARTSLIFTGSAILLCAAGLCTATAAGAAVFDPFYAGNFNLTDIGSVPAVPTRYGGLTFKAGDPNTLLIGGGANGSTGAIYQIGVTRDANGHVSGFSGN